MIEILTGDITKLQGYDAIVAAANQHLTVRGGAARQIAQAAGEGLEQALSELGGCSVGSAVITPGFALPAAYVIHAVGPLWMGGDHGERELLASCHEAALKLGEEHGIRSMVFCCIGTGKRAFPMADAAEIALTALSAHEDRFERLAVCCYDEEAGAIYQAALDARK